ncbi:DUF4251 domain-containing protein [Galbibacter sp. BG1]|uniref:DUF4251 domain-containing protein n=1 Tax=Galbibacter sp. BG1 TaxID=1170699 RepID=UPI0015BD4615|nr:DUF4251 domain-containing protein [Galbibacter sp. BG1]QLE02304.1 DUF4251 domain-containing protein [Galbibacter sp. BG1]
MKILQIIGIFVVSLCVLSCGGTQNAVSDADLAALDKIINDKNFRIECQWAMPTVSTSMMQIAGSGLLAPGNNVQRIDLSGDGAFLEIKGDSAKADLPFYGERQMGGGYNPDGEGIKFDQEVSDMEIEYQENKKHYRITFSANDGTKSFNVTLMVFQNKKTSVSVNSSERDFITYDGTLEEIPKKE